MSLRAVRSPEAQKMTTTVGGAPRCLLRPWRNGCLSESAMGMRDFFDMRAVGKGNGSPGLPPEAAPGSRPPGVSARAGGAPFLVAAHTLRWQSRHTVEYGRPLHS